MVEAFIGGSGIVVLQLALLTAALGLAVACMAFYFTAIEGALLALPFLLAPTPVFLCWRALTETLCLVLSLVLVALVVRGLCGPQVLWAIFLGSLLAVTKPAFVTAFGIALLLLTASVLLKRRGRMSSWPVIGALGALSPVIAQLTFSRAAVGTLSLSNASTENLSRRFYPAVVAEVEHGPGRWRDGYKSKFAATVLKRKLSHDEQAAYLKRNSSAAWRTYRTILMDQHLLAPSQFVLDRDTRKRVPRSVEKKRSALKGWSGHVNRFFTLLHATFAPVLFAAAVMLRRERAVWIAVGCFGVAASILLGAPLVYLQADRIIIAAMPYWAAAYVLVGGCIARKLLRRLRPQQAGRT